MAALPWWNEWGGGQWERDTVTEPGHTDLGPAAPHGGHRHLPEPAPAPPLPRPPPPSPLKNPGTCVSSRLTIAPPTAARPGTRERAAAGLAPPRPSLACVLEAARRRARAACPSDPELAKGGMEKRPVEVGRGVRARPRAHGGEHARALRTVPGQPPLLPRLHAPPSSGPALSQPLGSREGPLWRSCTED